MKPALVAFFGIVLAAQADRPKDMAARVLQAQDEQSHLSTWDNWYFEATLLTVLKYDTGRENMVVFVSDHGEAVIRSLATTYDYR